MFSARRCTEDSWTPTFSSQSSFTARLLGFRSCKGGETPTWMKCYCGRSFNKPNQTKGGKNEAWKQQWLTLWMISAEWMYWREKKMCITLQNKKNRWKKRTIGCSWRGLLRAAQRTPNLGGCVNNISRGITGAVCLLHKTSSAKWARRRQKDLKCFVTRHSDSRQLIWSWSAALLGGVGTHQQHHHLGRRPSTRKRPYTVQNYYFICVKSPSSGELSGYFFVFFSRYIILLPSCPRQCLKFL